MTINGTDISTWNAKQHTLQIGHSAITNSTEWTEGGSLPFFNKNKIGLTEIVVTLIFEGEHRYEINQDVSTLLANILNINELVFDNLDDVAPYKFRGVLSKYEHDETAMNHWHKLELTFDGYWHGDELEFSGVSNFTFTNPGNLISPARFVFTTTTEDEIGIGVNKIDDGWYITEQTVGQKIDLNGISGVIASADGEARYDLWELPTVPPGEVEVTCSDPAAELTVYVLPLYM